jgi:hypothetical protein
MQAGVDLRTQRRIPFSRYVPTVLGSRPYQDDKGLDDWQPPAWTASVGRDSVAEMYMLTHTSKQDTRVACPHPEQRPSHIAGEGAGGLLSGQARCDTHWLL